MVEIQPLTLGLNIILNKKGKPPQCELRRRIDIPGNNTPEWWADFFEAAIKGTPIKAEVTIKFTEGFKQVLKMNEIGLLKKDLVEKYHLTRFIKKI